MDNWGRASEIEQPRPFADRAIQAIEHLKDQRAALLMLFQSELAKPAIIFEISRAIRLLEEAVTRGVKGKDRPDESRT
jgi:hypothetical protein